MHECRRGGTPEHRLLHPAYGTRALWPPSPLHARPRPCLGSLPAFACLCACSLFPASCCNAARPPSTALDAPVSARSTRGRTRQPKSTTPRARCQDAFRCGAARTGTPTPTNPARLRAFLAASPPIPRPPPHSVRIRTRAPRCAPVRVERRNSPVLQTPRRPEGGCPSAVLRVFCVFCASAPVRSPACPPRCTLSAPHSAEHAERPNVGFGSLSAGPGPRLA